MKKTVCIVGLALSPALAFAADDSGKIWSGEANLSANYTSGNTNTENLHFRSKSERKGEQWNQIYGLEASNESSDDVRTAESYFGSAKGEYKLEGDQYLFGLLEYTKDRYSGFEYEATVTFGYGRDFIKNDRHELSADVGVGYRLSEEIDTGPGTGNKLEDAILRLGGVYIWKINENLTFDEELSVEVGDKRTITKSLTRLKVKIAGNLNGFVAYDIKHTTDVPQPTKNSDRNTLLGLDYSF